MDAAPGHVTVRESAILTNLLRRRCSPWPAFHHLALPAFDHYTEGPGVYGGTRASNANIMCGTIRCQTASGRGVSDTAVGVSDP